MADPEEDKGEQQEDDYNRFYDPDSDDAWEQYLAYQERQQNIQREQDVALRESVGEFFEEVGDTVGDAVDAVGEAISTAWDFWFGDDEDEKKEEDASN